MICFCGVIYEHLKYHDNHVELDDIFASGTSECFFFKLVVLVVIRYIASGNA